MANPGESVPDTGNRSGFMLLNSFAGQTVRIVFLWTVPEDFTGPAQFQLDNVRISGPPAMVPTLSVAGLTSLILLMLMAGYAAHFRFRRQS